MFRAAVRRCCDHYSVLGLQRAATQAQVRTAYLRLAREHHPDVSGGRGAADRFMRVQAAWEALRDPAKRSLLDQADAGPSAPVAYYAAARNTPEPWPSRRETPAQKEVRARKNLASLVEGRFQAEDALRLNFEHSLSTDDAALASLAQSLPRGVRHLALKFEGCSFSDSGLRSLACSISELPVLQSLALDLTGCLGITDGGVADLAAHFPQSLESLSLDLSYCRIVTDASIAALGRHLPKGLSSLRLGLVETAVGPRHRELADDLAALRQWASPSAAPTRRGRPRSAKVLLGAGKVRGRPRERVSRGSSRGRSAR